MAGAPLVVGALAAVALVGSTAVVGAGAAARAQQLGHAADAAALAAGDVLLGWSAGEPCAAAERLAAAHGASLGDCRVEASTVIVVVSGVVLGIRVERAARAGPPA
ncbi:helicase [Microcella daejeonensis]|jgi:secretion/DNA translocation related TadE-like protein|uniref:helicase n=1 Tax=Microcella daejeonensis TaxID=2994971 RepID=UPI00226EB99D|nr:helicase [Microcella daejeonensis]WAB84935.1 helicase [Microcella daejeonensis]